ncbi:hypothetical protein FSP39_007754 [Pinctada imbricata]|uniref:Uncharacterized protein n=1 Tax=Pinctada imbricata TaxID=66713 RepID=A0AA88YBD3_PINIB|nr:hypothetical protein FSP39_007754 [Pinctada imbricata]
MGHTQSKRRREKRLKKELSDYILSNLAPGAGDDETLHRVTQLKINRLSADLERLSIASSYLSKDSSVFGSDSKHSTMSLNRSLYAQLNAGRQDLEGVAEVGMGVDGKQAFSYEKLNVDDDPVLTKLQNEQNRRLERMEKRMSQIKLHAMQEVERRKFAHMFRAKNEPTTELLHKAKDTLVKDCERELSEHSSADDVRTDVRMTKLDSDKGEIIPVTIVKDRDCDQTEGDNSEKKVVEKKSLFQTMPALNNMDLNDPKSYLFLPFLFPIFVILMVLRSLQQSEAWQRNSGNSRHKKRN